MHITWFFAIFKAKSITITLNEKIFRLCSFEASLAVLLEFGNLHCKRTHLDASVKIDDLTIRRANVRPDKVRTMKAANCEKTNFKLKSAGHGVRLFNVFETT